MEGHSVREKKRPVNYLKNDQSRNAILGSPLYSIGISVLDGNHYENDNVKKFITVCGVFGDS